MDAQALLRHHLRALPEGGADGPRLFTAGSTDPNPPNACLAAAAFQGALANTHAGWARADATHPASDLCGGWTRQKRVVIVPGLRARAHAVVFNDGSALLGRIKGSSLQLYPGVVWLRSKAYGYTFSVHMGGADGPARLVLRRGGDVAPTVLEGADLRESHPERLHAADTAAWWAWALRTDVDRLDAVFDRTTEAHRVPAPGEGHAARPGYPLFLPRPGLDAAALASSKALAEEALDWVACAVARHVTDPIGSHPAPTGITRHGPRGWTFGWLAGVHSRVLRAQWEPADLPTYFPPKLAAALDAVGAQDLGWRWNTQRTGHFDTPVGAAKLPVPPSAHATIALLAAWGAPNDAHLEAWTALFRTAP